MKCFYHDEKNAVAMCKSCMKGLCRECAVEIGNAVACREKCEREVGLLNDLLAREKTVFQKQAASYVSNALFFLVMGIIFIVLGMMESRIPPLRIAMLAFGIPSLFFAYSNYSMSKKWKRSD